MEQGDGTFWGAIGVAATTIFGGMWSFLSNREKSKAEIALSIKLKEQREKCEIEKQEIREMYEQKLKDLEVRLNSERLTTSQILNIVEIQSTLLETELETKKPLLQKMKELIEKAKEAHGRSDSK